MFNEKKIPLRIYILSSRFLVKFNIWDIRNVIFSLPFEIFRSNKNQRDYFFYCFMLCCSGIQGFYQILRKEISAVSNFVKFCSGKFCEILQWQIFAKFQLFREISWKPYLFTDNCIPGLCRNIKYFSLGCKCYESLRYTKPDK